MVIDLVFLSSKSHDSFCNLIHETRIKSNQTVSLISLKTIVIISVLLLNIYFLCFHGWKGIMNIILLFF